MSMKADLEIKKINSSALIKEASIRQFYSNNSPKNSLTNSRWEGVKKLTGLVKRQTFVMFGMSLVLLTNCVSGGDKAVIGEVVQASAAVDSKHEFTVDPSGSVIFKAEIVYFNFDDFTLTREGMDRLNALADYLANNSAKQLVVEGHCDERGSIEYNLALGHLRAHTVRNYLLNMGITERRLGAISFGKESPAELGSNEKAWSQNRRAEFRFAQYDD